MHDEKQVVLHRGFYKPTASVMEAVFMITGMTIGAGILGLPYAVSRVGLLPGLALIFSLGIVMLFFNLMLGEIAIRAGEPMQVPGFAGKYLGRWAKFLLSAVTLFGSFGTLLVYIIGEGESLSSIFGGQPFMWSIIFWSLGSLLIWAGLERIKIIEKIFGVIIMTIIGGISFFLLSKFNLTSASYFNGKELLYPIGVILFALHASPAIAEAHALLPGSERHFRKALMFGTLIPVGLYLLFTIAVVGFSGLNTTEIATVGLGVALGPAVNVFANIFAALAMSTGFIGMGTALKETLMWDHKTPEIGATFVVIALPLALFLIGFRSFIGVLGIVGSISMGIEGIIMAGVYLSARKGKDALPERYFVPTNPLIFVLPVVLFFGSILVFSIYDLVLR